MMGLLWELYISFAKIGALTFGGGYSMMPILQRELGKRGWITSEEILDYFALAQCIPGIISVNSAAFIGNKVRGRAGGLACVLGTVTPSLIIILVIAAFIRSFIQYEIVQKAFFGVRVVVCALIFQSISRLWGSAMKGRFSLFVYAGILTLSLFTPLPTYILVVAAVAAGLVNGAVIRGRGEK